MKALRTNEQARTPRKKPAKPKRLPLPPAIYHQKVAGRTCRLCERTDVEAHHLVERKHFAPDDPLQHHADNIAPLCRDHHAGHTSRNHPMPWSALSPDEQRFVVWAKDETWARRVYA